MAGARAKHVGVVAFAVVLLMLLGGGALAAADDREGTRQEFVLRVGAQEDIQTTNYFAHKLSPDVWTANVLEALYGEVLLTDPETDELLPYIARGADFDENGVFESDEVGVFAKAGGTDTRNVTVYYDLSGVRFHDGTQVTVRDLLFSYHAHAKMPNSIGLDVLRNATGLQVYRMDDLNVWEDEGTGLPSTDSYRVALQFRLQRDYWRFYRNTVSVVLLPQHIWAGTGSIVDWPADSDSSFAGQTIDCTHADWGIAVDPVTWRGVPETSGNAWNLNDAAGWAMPAGCVIGSGPFLWEQWVPGSFAKIRKNADFFTTTDASGYEYIHPPFLDGMRYQIYKTVQAAVFALHANEIDVISWSIPLDQVADLHNNPDITVTSNAERGFAYMGYHMQIAGGAPWAYENGDPSKPDIGIPFRQAVAHTIDKKNIQPCLIPCPIVPADSVVSPVWTRWYNSSLPQYDFDLAQAAAILDTFSTDPAGTCQIDGTGCRSFAGIGTSLFDIQCPEADYDPLQAAACSMIETQMRAVGINVEANHLAFSQMVQNLDSRTLNYSLWISGARIGSEPPDHLYAMFHSSQYPVGLNAAGYANQTFDRLLEDTRANLDEDFQTSQVKYAQWIIANDRPVEPLYYKSNIEAYRNDRTRNWTVGPYGSIFTGSYWSWIGVKPPRADALKVAISTASAIASAGSVPVKVTVRDPDLWPFGGASVTLKASAGTWSNPDPSDPTGLTTTGTTTPSGQFFATYIAPDVTEKLKVFLAVAADDPDGLFTPSLEISTVITVFPPEVEFLSITLDPTSDVTAEGDLILVFVTVRDQDWMPVPEANVTVTVDPPGLATVSPEQGVTDASGTIPGGVLFRLDDLGGAESRSFRLTFNVSKAGYAESPGGVLVVTVYEIVVDCFEGVCETEEFPLWLWVLPLAVTAIVVGFLVLRRWRRARGQLNGEGIRNETDRRKEADH
jgi:ABC-type transport system substrate-binding protein